MKFKDADAVAQYDRAPAKLKEICEVFVSISKDNGIDAVVTRVTDPVAGESGVHPEGRAVDFRDQYFDGKTNRALYSMELVDEITELLNNQFKRDDGKLVCIHHSFENGPFHFHLQIPYDWCNKDDLERLKNAPK